MLACSNAASGGDNPPVIPANLVGTWARSHTTYNRDGQGNLLSTRITTDSFTFSADGSFGDSRTETYTPTTGTASTTYVGMKGTASFPGDALAIVFTSSRQSTAPFADATSGWEATSQSFTYTTTVIRNKLYGLGGDMGYTFKASGSVSGIVGAWETRMSMDQGTTPFYMKEILTFNADGTCHDDYYESATSTFADTPKSTGQGTYDAAAGTFTIGSAPLNYSISGQYLLTSDGAMDKYAYVKQ
jgi:hypothetical protein